MAMEEDARRGYCYVRRESTLKHMLSGGSFLTRPPTACSFPSTGAAWLILECARRTRPFRGRAFREQEDDQANPSLCFHHFQSRIEFMPAGRATDAIRFDCKFV